MALKFIKSGLNENIKVIVRIDDALDSDYEEFSDDYQRYLETLDESILRLKEGKQPTRFVLKKHLKYDEQYDIRSRQLKVDKKKNETSLNISFIFDEIRFRLIAIENPQGEEDCIAYKADGAGGASKETMEKLMSLGITEDLYFAVTNTTSKLPDVDKKKS